MENLIQDIMESISGLPAFALYLGIALLSLYVFKLIYTLMTPYDEWKLVKENNSAAALALVGSIVGFSIAISSAISNSDGMIDFVVWSVVALIAQLIAFAIIRLAFLPKVVERIENGELAAGIILAGMSISVGLLNAACMTW
jgi:putative membrane protein